MGPASETLHNNGSQFNMRLRDRALLADRHFKLKGGALRV